MRKLVGITALFAGLAILFSAGAMPAYADPGNSGNANTHGGNPSANPKAQGGNSNSGGNANAAGSANGGSANGGSSQAGDPNGANGTVKIHDWPQHKNGAEMANDPKVCQFEIHGFKFDRGQTGRWWIQEHTWGNGDASKAVLSGSYGPADANGDWTSGPHKLADGHYKLFVEMTHKAGNSGNTVVTYKMKVFKVDCEETSEKKTEEQKSEVKKTEEQKSEVKKTEEQKSEEQKTEDSNSTNTTNTTTDLNSTTTVRTIETGNVVIRIETTTFTEAGKVVRIVRIFNNDVLVLSFDSRTAPSVVAGFESAPTGAANIGTGPEVPSGMGLDDSQAPNAVNGVQSGPAGVGGSESAPALAGIASLPATSTGAAGLGLAGLAITGLGFALLRRQPK